MLRSVFFFIFSFWMLLGIKAQVQQPFILVLICPVSTPDGVRELKLEHYPRIHVQLLNVSDKSQKLWKSWNSWGWTNLKILIEADGEVKTIRHIKPLHWEGDFPDFWTLAPGESVILEVDMSSGEWEGFPDLYGETLNAGLTAIYECKADVLSKDYGIWAGKVVSNQVDVVFR